MFGIMEFFGGLLYSVYNIMPQHSYGFALIIFTFVIKLVLLPLAVKSSKSTMKMQELQPQIKEIQAKYKDDREAMNKEMMKLYQENSFNPAGGCLPALVQLPVLYLLFRIVAKPISYMLGGDKFVEEIKKIDEYSSIDLETNLINSLTSEKIDILIKKGGEISELLSNGLAEKILDLKDGMYLFGMNLSLEPSYSPDKLFGEESHIYLPLLLIPILATVAMFYSSKTMMNKTPSSTAANGDAAGDMAANMQKKMVYLGPVLTLVFSFQFPAGLGIYWIASSVFQIFQQQFINNKMEQKKEVEVK